MKKTFLKFFAAVLMVGFAAVSVGCKDYDDDIDALNSAVAGLQQTISSLQSQINNGKTITGVTNTADGVTVTLSDGSSFTITNGKDGKDGGAGAASSVWTIGDDGFWYENGKVTEFKAIGTDGVYYVPVTEGEHKGEWQVYQNGEPVEPAQYEGSWLGEGITAVMDGGLLTLYGVKDAEGNVIEDGITITQGGSLGSLVFDPAVLDETTLYPTTEEEFYVMPAVPVKDAAKPWNNKAKTFVSLSNVVDMPYFINPADAYISDNASMYNFVVKDVTIRTRAEEAVAPLVAKAVDLESVEGQVIVKAQVNSDFLAEADEDDFEGDAVLVAVQAWAGTSVVTSDFIALTAPKEIEAVALGKYDAKAYKELGYVVPDGKQQYKSQWNGMGGPNDPYAWALSVPVNYTAKAFNSNDYLLQVLTSVNKGKNDFDYNSFTSYIPNNEQVTTDKIFELSYDDGELDLAPIVKLYGKSDKNWYELESLGFDPEDITYEFSLPKEFYPTAADKNTNQQEFVTLDGSVVKLGSYGTSSVGRTPVVYVTASIDGQLVAAGYVIVKIVPGSEQTGDELVVEFPAAGVDADKIYNNLTDFTGKFPAADVTTKTSDADGSKGAYNVVGVFDWSEFNKTVYDALNSYPEKFWADYYTDVDVTVTVEATEAEAKAFVKEKAYVAADKYKDVWKDNVLTLAKFKYDAGTTISGDAGQADKTTLTKYNTGIELYLNKLNQNGVSTQTTQIRIAVNELVRTQHTFGMYEDKGAHYTVTMTFQPKAKKDRPVVITQDFYVSHDHENSPEFGPFFYNDADKAELNARGITDEQGAALDADKGWAFVTGNWDEDAWYIQQEFKNLFKDAKIDELGGNIDYALFWFTARDFENGMYYLGKNNKGNGTNGLSTDENFFYVTDAAENFNPTKNATSSDDMEGMMIGLTVSEEVAGEDEEAAAALEITNDLMYRDHIARTLNFIATLKNGEECDPNFFYIIFRNEFAVANSCAIEFENGSAAQTKPLFDKNFAVVEDMLTSKNLTILEWVKETDKDGVVTYEGFKVSEDPLANRGMVYDGSDEISATNSFVITYEISEAEMKKVPNGAKIEVGTKEVEVPVEDADPETYTIPTVTWEGGTAQIGDPITINVTVTVNIGGAFKVETTIPVTIKHRG